MKIETYGLLRQILAPELEIALSTPATVQTVLHALAEQYPEFAAQQARTACAIGDQLVQRDHLLDDGATLVLIPPVAGG